MPEQNQKDVTHNPPGERSERSQASEQKPPQGPGQASPGLKDKEAETSDSYGNTRDSGEPAFVRALTAGGRSRLRAQPREEAETREKEHRLERGEVVRITEGPRGTEGLARD